MLTGVVCYIERTPGGNGLRRLRLVGPELDQSWVAPSAPGQDPGKPLAPGEQLAHIRAAAAWIAEEIAPSRELVAVCLDPEGGVCSWISSPSADHDVVMAAIRQIGSPTTGAAIPTEANTQAGGFGLLPDDNIGIGSTRSVQALAEPEVKSHTSVLPSSKKQPVGPRKRLGVLSVADAPVRVLLDELDRARVGVGAVISFWHAAALAWGGGGGGEPGVASRSRTSGAKPSQNGAHDPLEPIVIEPDAPVTAAVIVDPSGRLIWSWSRNGDLLAAGAMKLRTHTYSRGPVHAAADPDLAPSDSGILDLPPPAQRILPDEAVETISAAECSSGDVGRLIMDWLSWSVQVGHAPDRVVCIGPATIPHRPTPSEPPPSPASIAQALAGAWPGATVDAAIHEDPVGATLNRLRALPMFAPSKNPAAEMTLPEDPRQNLVTLTNRPGRFDRKMHYWAMLAILAAAVAVFLYARRVGSGIDGLRTERSKAQADRLQVLQGIEDLVPDVSKSPDPIGMISGKIQEINDQLNRLSPSVVTLERLLPAFQVFKEPEFASVQLTSIQASEVDFRIDFTIPEDEDEIVTAIRVKLNEKYGERAWEGSRLGVTNQRLRYSVYWRIPGGTKQ